MAAIGLPVVRSGVVEVCLVSQEPRWIGEPVAGDKVTERTFLLERPSGDVPGVLWLPAAAAEPDRLCCSGTAAAGTSETTGSRLWRSGLAGTPAWLPWRSTVRITVTACPLR